MRFFLQTADLPKIKRLARIGVIDGAAVTPDMVVHGTDAAAYHQHIAEIAAVVAGPVCAHVTAASFDAMMAEASELSKIGKNVTASVPAIEDGFAVCKMLAGTGVLSAVRLCYSAGQAVLAAKAGATFVMPNFSGSENSGDNGLRLVGDICDVFRNYPAAKTEIFVAALSNVSQVIDCAKIGAHGALLKPHIVTQLSNHASTDKELAKLA